jgi:hypothetical protein
MRLFQEKETLNPMTNPKKTTHQKLVKIIKEDYEGCEWFIISANELMQKLNESIELCNNNQTSLETIKNFIGEIGIGIGNVQRCLDGVEDCYTKTVELLSKEITSSKR